MKIKIMEKERAPRNRTMTLSGAELKRYAKRLARLETAVSAEEVLDKTICQDVREALKLLPDSFVDLLFADPPYNLAKSFNGRGFQSTSLDEYEARLDSWLGLVVRLLKPTASVYVCGDWRSSGAIEHAGAKYFKVRNRITWEREKGRGARANWKSCAEDIWFFTVGDDYTFNARSVMLKRRVMAPYMDRSGVPKSWEKEENGNYRLTHPSNLWTDLVVPFWSMTENTDHPTQKPEKLVAKIILASTREGDVVLDPFLGSGTTSVAAKKLNRRYVGIEIDEGYCCLAEKRLAKADEDRAIQGYADGVFWERNTLARRNKEKEFSL